MNLELMPRTRSHDVSGFWRVLAGRCGAKRTSWRTACSTRGVMSSGHRLLGTWLDGPRRKWKRLDAPPMAYGRYSRLRSASGKAALKRFENPYPSCRHPHLRRVDGCARDALAAAARSAWTRDLGVGAGALHRPAPADPPEQLIRRASLSPRARWCGATSRALDRWLHGRRATEDPRANLPGSNGASVCARFAAGDDELSALGVGNRGAAGCPSSAEVTPRTCSSRDIAATELDASTNNNPKQPHDRRRRRCPPRTSLRYNPGRAPPPN